MVIGARNLCAATRFFGLYFSGFHIGISGRQMNLGKVQYQIVRLSLHLNEDMRDRTVMQWD